MATPPEDSFSPEVMFLVKAQAKAMAQINALEKRVKQLEQLVDQKCEQCQHKCHHKCQQCAHNQTLTQSTTSASTSSAVFGQTPPAQLFGQSRERSAAPLLFGPTQKTSTSKTLLEQMSQNLVNTSTNTTTKVSAAKSKERVAISDDSGGEYSQLSTTSYDDELSFLLDQIQTRCRVIHSLHKSPLNLGEQTTNLLFKK